MPSKETILSQATEFLTNQPFDAGHDLEHHQTVLSIAQDIASHIDEPVNSEALEIAAMWHDVVTEQNVDATTADRNQIKLQTCNYLENLLSELKYPTEFTKQVILAVRYHSYEDEPRNMEGKVLYDADKLSAIDLARWRKVVMAHQAKKISDETFNNYLIAGKQWVSEMLDKLHFEYSKQLFKNRMQAVMRDEWARQLALQIGVDVSEYV